MSEHAIIIITIIIVVAFVTRTRRQVRHGVDDKTMRIFPQPQER